MAIACARTTGKSSLNNWEVLVEHFRKTVLATTGGLPAASLAKVLSVGLRVMSTARYWVNARVAPAAPDGALRAWAARPGAKPGTRKVRAAEAEAQASSPQQAQH